MRQFTYFDEAKKEVFSVPVKGRSGIYGIVNMLNGHKYVGKALDIERRWIKHLNDLKSQRHVNRHLQAAVNIYGVGNFTFVVLEFENTVAVLDQKEMLWIEKLQPEYNIITTPRFMAEGRDYDFYLTPEKDIVFRRPEWHSWVYGSMRNPQVFNS